MMYLYESVLSLVGMLSHSDLSCYMGMLCAGSPVTVISIRLSHDFMIY